MGNNQFICLLKNSVLMSKALSQLLTEKKYFEKYSAFSRASWAVSVDSLCKMNEKKAKKSIY